MGPKFRGILSPQSEIPVAPDSYAIVRSDVSD